jgi:hypothetical protein
MKRYQIPKVSDERSTTVEGELRKLILPDKSDIVHDPSGIGWMYGSLPHLSARRMLLQPRSCLQDVVRQLG